MMNLRNNILYQFIKEKGQPKATAFLLFASFIIIISLVFLGVSIGKPHMGIILSSDSQGWAVTTVDPNGEAMHAGVTVGDKPIRINSQPAENYLDEYRQHGFIFGQLITDIAVIDSSGQTIYVTLAGNSPSIQARLEQLAWMFVCIIFWATGFFVYFKKPNDISALLLCLCGLVLGLALNANMAGERAIPIATPVAIVATIISPWLLLHFSIVLPEERIKIRNNPLLYLIYLPAAMTLILFPLFGYANGQPLPWFRSLRLFEYGIGLFLVASVAIFNYLKSASTRTHQQMKIVLISCIIALTPIVFLNILPQAIWKQPAIPPGFSILFLVFIPLGIGYAMVTKKLMDIDIVIRRGVIYGLVTLVMAAVLSIAIFFILNYPNLLNPLDIILIALASGVVAAILFGPLKKGIEFLIDKFFYKDRYDYRQIIKSLTLSLNSLTDITEISRLIIGTTVNTLNLAGGCLLAKTHSDLFEIYASQDKFTDKKIQKQLCSLISQRTQITEFPNSASPLHPDLAFIIPLITGGKEVGVLCLSQKVSRQDYSSDDMYLLQEIASVAALELHSNMLIHDVSMRDTFISVASHELRTPLTSIIGYTDLLLRRNPTEVTRKRWLDNVLQNSYRVRTMVDDLLDVSRIQSGKINLKMEKVKVLDVFEEILSFLRESANDHEFKVNIEDDLPNILVDRDKFTEVVGNILDNAIKYSPSGSRITLSARNSESSHQVVVSITDEGIGISPEDKKLLFTTFHRIQRHETQGIRGSGLGLYIAKQFTEVMQGKIWVESKLYKGSTFFVSVPTENDNNTTIKDTSISQL